MNWFQRRKDGVDEKTEKKELPNVWRKCDKCGEVLYKKDVEANFFMCLKCSYHFRIFARTYIEIMLDKSSFIETNENMISVDPFDFVDTKKYSDRIQAMIKKTKIKDAIRTGHGTIEGRLVMVAIMDFGFIGGSMGSVVGEKISRAIDVSYKNKLPIIIVSASGGARMMEGALSLMQMAKTSAKLAMLHEIGIPYISLLTDPTTGGVTASFAMLGDVILAEPGALIGFAGPRVVKEATGKDLPEGFQTAEFLVEHGFVDLIVPRNQLKPTLSRLMKFFEPNTNLKYEAKQTEAL